MASVVSRLVMTWRNRMELHFLEPYYPNQEERQNPDLFARNVRAVMARYMNVPVSEHSQLDVQMLIEHQRVDPEMNSPFSGTPLKAFGDSLLYSGTTIKLLSSFFREITRKEDAFVSRAEFMLRFASVIGCENAGADAWLSRPSIASEVFDVLDIERRGFVSLQEFIVGFLCIAEAVNLGQEERYKWLRRQFSQRKSESDEEFWTDAILPNLRDAALFRLGSANTICACLRTQAPLSAADFESLPRRNPVLSATLQLALALPA